MTNEDRNGVRVRGVVNTKSCEVTSERAVSPLGAIGKVVVAVNNPRSSYSETFGWSKS
jgi:hypothetical protein